MKYILSILLILNLISCKQSYNKDLWIKNNNQSSENLRFEMVKDLRKNYLLKGMSSKKVFDLLDKAEVVDTTNFGIHWTYSIGSNPGFNIDLYYLVIDFDHSGNLVETRIEEH